MSEISKPKPALKIWLETDEGYVFGPGVYSLLKKLNETGTLKNAARSLGMSYRFAWGLIKKAEEKLGQPLIITHKGGRSGGGGATITEVGCKYLKEFSNIEFRIKSYSKDSNLKAGTTNELKGKIKDLSNREDLVLLTLDLEMPTKLKVLIPENDITEVNLTAGDKLKLKLFTIVADLEKIKV